MHYCKDELMGFYLDIFFTKTRLLLMFIEPLQLNFVLIYFTDAHVINILTVVS